MLNETLEFQRPMFLLDDQDEIGLAQLRLDKRISLRQAEAKAIKEKGEFGIGKSIFARELPWLGEGHHIAVAMGATDSEVRGLDLTQHAFLWRPESLETFLGLDREKRRTELAKKICEAKHFVIGINGWAGTQCKWEAYEAITLKPLEGENLTKAVSQIIGTPGFQGLQKEHLPVLTRDVHDLANQTMVIDLSIMGGLYGLDLENAEELTNEGVILQVFEALDKIGKEVTEIKIKEIESPEWSQKKREIITALVEELIAGGLNGRAIANFSGTEQINNIQELQQMLEDEELVANGIYFDTKIDLLKGHSMGGNIASEIMPHVLMGKKMGDMYVQYRREHDTELQDFVRELKTRVEKANEEIFSNEEKFDFSVFEENEQAIRYLAHRKNLDLSYVEILQQIRELVSSQMNLTSVDQLNLVEVKTKYPNMTFQSWMQVVFGDHAENLPGWGERIKRVLEEKQNFPKNLNTFRSFIKKIFTGENSSQAYVTLQKDPLLSLVLEIAKRSKKAAKGSLILGDISGLIDILLNKYVGSGLPEDLNPLYKLSLKESIEFVLTCDRILKDMSAPWDDETMNLITPEHLAKWTMFIGDDDKTLLSALIEAMGEEVMSRFGLGQKSVIHKFEETGHHPQLKDMSVIVADQWGKLLYAKYKQLEKSKGIQDQLIKWFDQRILVNNLYSGNQVN